MQLLIPGLTTRRLPACNLLLITGLLSCSTALFAADEPSTLSAEKLEMAQQKAQSCATCHGENGIAVLDLAPNLAGQKSMYTAIQLKAYRSGERKNEIMNITAKMLTDDDIQLLADYYQSLSSAPAAEDKPEC